MAGEGPDSGQTEASTLQHVEKVRQNEEEQKEDTARLQKKVEHSANPMGK